MLKIVNPKTPRKEVEQEEYQLYDTIQSMLNILDMAMHELQLEAPTIPVEVVRGKERKLILDFENCTLTLQLPEWDYDKIIFGPATAYCTLIYYSKRRLIPHVAYLASLDELVTYLMKKGINLDKKQIALALIDQEMSDYLNREYIGINNDVLKRFNEALPENVIETLFENFMISRSHFYGYVPVLWWLVTLLLQRARRLGTVKTILAVIDDVTIDFFSLIEQLESETEIDIDKVKSLLISTDAGVSKLILRLKEIYT